MKNNKLIIRHCVSKIFQSSCRQLIIQFKLVFGRAFNVNLSIVIKNGYLKGHITSQHHIHPCETSSSHLNSSQICVNLSGWVSKKNGCVNDDCSQ